MFNVSVSVVVWWLIDKIASQGKSVVRIRYIGMEGIQRGKNGQKLEISKWVATAYQKYDLMWFL